MAKQSFEMHLYAREEWASFDSDTPEIAYRLVQWGPSDTSSSFGLYVGPVTVEAEVPDAFDLRSAKLKAKQEELEKVRAELGARVTQIMREIQQLTALEMS